jgi:hypothetical protein
MRTSARRNGMHIKLRLVRNELSNARCSGLTLRVPHASAHRRRSVHLNWDALVGLVAAVGLFAFFQLHGVNERDRFFVFELSTAALVFVLSFWGALRAFNHQGRWNRRVGLVTFAVLLTTLLLATLLSSMADPRAPQRIEYGE